MKNINDLLQENRDSQDNIFQAADFSKSTALPGDDFLSTSSNGNDFDMHSPSHPQPHPNSHDEDDTRPSADLDLKMKEMEQKEIEEETKHKANSLGVGYINLVGIPIPAEVLKLVDLSEAKEKQILPFYYAQHKVIRLATNLQDVSAIIKLQQEFAERFKMQAELFLASDKSFETAIKQYEALPKIKAPSKGVDVSKDDLDKFSVQIQSLDQVGGLMESVSTTELVTLIIAAGLKIKSSDIHIEAEVDGVKLRYRIDGVLHTACTLTRDRWQNLISRLKLLSGLKINITTEPQDGRFSIFLDDEDKVDVRVSTLPTAYGESVVMRLLLSKAANLNLDDLGLNNRSFELLSKQIKRPNGMIITTGPTGSGKTTTLYAILNKLNQPETKIITIEDPIEYELKGINQSQVDKKYTFAKGLRSIVRQDPDVVMVGEMRDLDTTEIALNAALTGHLVLSTLHTNNAAGAIPRFLAMGAKPYLLAPSLNLIIAQRLVRRLCSKCKQPQELSADQKDRIRDTMGVLLEKENIDLNQVKFYKAVGCEECSQIGYSGRVGVFEMFEMNKEVEQNILSGEVSEYEIKEIAVKNGMITMVQDGLLKAIKGETSVDEVFRMVE